ncbi:hypothetical protein AVEN_183144-1 [Araneus ventricosus]|uniref:Uncharacterized protein n=1 Tax=Araneus ventricosus TaxID=182803 RepID=A0A4Y2IMI8_ARAVE|nr:hypothetical protein AVEN_183144-1 [Araneus ventricosus]
MDTQFGNNKLDVRNCPTSSELFRLSEEAKVLMVEVVAIRQTVRYIIGRQLRQSKIISVSRSALMFLAPMHERRVIIDEIKDNIREYLGTSS